MAVDHFTSDDAASGMRTSEGLGADGAPGRGAAGGGAADGLRPGLTVRTHEGRKLGTLVALEPGALVVESGFFWPRRTAVSRSDVGRVEGGEVHLLEGSHAQRRDESEGAGHASFAGAPAAGTAFSDADLGEGLEAGGGALEGREAGDGGLTRTHAGEGELRVPLAREEATPVVRPRSAGAVRLRKVVRTETRTFTVQVRREELVVERLPVDALPTDALSGDGLQGDGLRGDGAPSGGAAWHGTPAPAAGAFEEQEQVVPLWREDVQIVTRPVVYEQVRLRKEVEQRTWQAEVPLRREVVRVEEEGEVHAVRRDADASPPGH
jgi:stress response protein YsnF